MRHPGEIGNHRITRDVLAKCQRQRRTHIRIDLRTQDFRQLHSLTFRVWDFEPHATLARYSFDHTNADNRQGTGKITREVDDLASFHAYRWLDFVARNDR